MYSKNVVTNGLLFALTFGFNLTGYSRSPVATTNREVRDISYLTKAPASDAFTISGEDIFTHGHLPVVFQQALASVPKKDSEEIFFGYIKPATPMKYEFAAIYFDVSANPNCQRVIVKGFWQYSILTPFVGAPHQVTQYYFGPDNVGRPPVNGQSKAKSPLELSGATQLLRQDITSSKSDIYFFDIIRIEANTACALRSY